MSTVRFPGNSKGKAQPPIITKKNLKQLNGFGGEKIGAGEKKKKTDEKKRFNGHLANPQAKEKQLLVASAHAKGRLINDGNAPGGLGGGWFGCHEKSTEKGVGSVKTENFFGVHKHPNREPKRRGKKPGGTKKRLIQQRTAQKRRS